MRILIRKEHSSTKNIKFEYIYYIFFMVIMCWFVDNVARLISLTFEDLQQSTTCQCERQASVNWFTCTRTTALLSLKVLRFTHLIHLLLSLYLFLSLSLSLCQAQTILQVNEFHVQTKQKHRVKLYKIIYTLSIIYTQRHK